MMQRVLTAHRLSCVNAPELATVLEAIQSHEAALVIMTEAFLTPSRDLDRFVDCLNQQPAWSDVPVIFLLKDCQQFLPCLMFLEKSRSRRNTTLLELPLKQREFLSVVQTCLYNRQRQLALRDILCRLEASNQALENYSHTVSHELRNPLGVVTNSLELLTRSELQPKQKKLAQMGLNTSKKMNRTLQTLLEYGKLNAGELIDFESVEMTDVIAQAMQGLQALVDERQARIRWQPDLPSVWGNRELLIRLLSNLIKNAIVHNNAETPRVTISAEEQPERYQFRVTDNGPGIASEDRDRIFTMFARSKHQVTEGSGIGLALCRRIVEQHRGTLSLQSELGKGSTFYFDLPKGDRRQS